MYFKIGFAILLFIGLVSLFLNESSHPNNIETKTYNDSIQAKISSDWELKSQKINDYFETKHKLNGFNGAVLFAENEHVVYKNVFGLSNFKTKEEIKFDTKFQIASVSKTFTSYAIMLLKQRGELDYEDTVQKYFSKFPYEGITIRLLMIHKSGLPEYFYFAEKLWNDKKHPITNKALLDLMTKEIPLRYFLPDKKYNYINTNYAILAAIIEKISGDTFENFMKNEIFRPLEMNDTFIFKNSNTNHTRNIAIGYDKIGRVAENTYLNGVVGDKGIYTTVDDLYKFDKALKEGLLVKNNILSKAFEPAHDRLYINDNYGLGWRINAADSTNKIVYHTGWWKGFRAYFIRELGKNKTIIVLSNVAKSSIFNTKELIELFD